MALFIGAYSRIQAIARFFSRTPPTHIIPGYLRESREATPITLYVMRFMGIDGFVLAENLCNPLAAQNLPRRPFA